MPWVDSKMHKKSENIPESSVTNLCFSGDDRTNCPESSAP